MKRKKKAFWKSKTFWVAVLSLLAQVLGQGFGIPVSEELINQLLPVLMVVLRAITKEPIGLKDEYEEEEQNYDGKGKEGKGKEKEEDEEEEVL